MDHPRSDLGDRMVFPTSPTTALTLMYGATHLGVADRGGSRACDIPFP